MNAPPKLGVFLLVLSGNFVSRFKETIMRKISPLFIVLGLLYTACTPNNVKTDDAIVKIMDSANVTGSFALMENGSGQFTITNLSAYKDSAYAPLNTFFAVPTLLGLDKGYIHQSINNLIAFDSVNYYKELISKIGRVNMLKSIDSLQYGKGIISADSTMYWANNSLRITPDEQLGFIKKLYFTKLPFQKRSQELFKKLIIKEDNTSYKLSYIDAVDTEKGNSWIVGYIEENKHPYFFVLYTHAMKPIAASDNASALLKRILLQQGFLKGVR